MVGRADIRGTTRATFLARAAVATGALYGTGAVAPLVERALAAAGGGDEAVLAFALTLERIEAAVYAKAVTVRGLSPRVKKALQEISGHEAEHVKQLTQTLQQIGASAPPAPKTSFPAPAGEAALLGLAITLEETGVGAYNGAAPRLQSPDYLDAFGSIVQVEARHAGALRELAGRNPAPAAFDRALTGAQVLRAVRPYVRGGP